MTKKSYWTSVKKSWQKVQGVLTSYTKEVRLFVASKIAAGMANIGEVKFSYVIRKIEKSSINGLMGAIPMVEVETLLPLEGFPTLMAVNEEEENVLQFDRPVGELREVVNSVKEKTGLCEGPTKPSAIKKKFSIAEKLTASIFKYQAVSAAFVQKWAGAAAIAGEEGITAIVNFLYVNGLFPVTMEEARNKIGSLGKYLNHGWVGSLQDITLVVLKDKVVSLEKEADGHAYVRQSDWIKMIDRFGALPWDVEKIVSLLGPRMIKPIVVGNAFGKGTLVPLSDKEFAEKFAIPAYHGDKVLIVGDKNFVKFFNSNKVKEDQQGNLWMHAKMGLHDAPIFGIKKVQVTPSTLLRLSLTEAQVKVWAKYADKNLKELISKIQKEGVQSLLSAPSENDEGEEYMLEKDQILTQALFLETTAKRALAVVKEKIIEKVFSIPAYQFSGYAVAPFGDIEKAYQDGRACHLDVFINPLDKEVFMNLPGFLKYVRKVLGGRPIFTIGRFPAISPLAFNQGRVFTHESVPRGGVVVHPANWMSKQGDFDGDTVNIRLYPFQGVGHKLTLEKINSVPQPKGATAGEFPVGDFARVLAQGFVAQNITGLCDNKAFNALVLHSNVKPSELPAWGAFTEAAELLQMPLDGIKKPIVFPENEPVSGKENWIKLITGKEFSPSRGTGSWKSSSVKEVTETLFKKNKKGEIVTPKRYLLLKDSMVAAITLANSVTLEKPEYQKSPEKSGDIVPLITDLSLLEKAMRVNGVEFEDGLHSISVEMIRSFIEMEFRKPYEVVVSELFGYYASEGDFRHYHREKLLHWCQKLIGKPLNQVASHLEYKLRIVLPEIKEEQTFGGTTP